MRIEDIFMTRSEVAKLLKVKPRSVAEIKELVPIKINSRLLRYRVEDVELWLSVLMGGNR
jgi:hypothetical protein